MTSELTSRAQDEFLAGFVRAADAVADALVGPDDARLRLEVAAGICGRMVFERFLTVAGRPDVCPDELGPGFVAPHPEEHRSRLPEGARAPVRDLLGRFRLAPAEQPAGGIDSAVGPEVLAAAYEQTRAGRHADGVFYTPAGEVRLMCRAALHAFLAGRLGWDARSPDLLALVHGGPVEGLGAHRAEAAFRTVAALRVVDPAAGCGALLVGMAAEMARVLAALAPLLDEPVRRSLRRDGLPDPSSEPAIRRHVVSQRLFGVDLDSEALRNARRRLLLFALAGGSIRQSARMCANGDAGGAAAEDADDGRSAVLDVAAELSAHLRVGDGLSLDTWGCRASDTPPEPPRRPGRPPRRPSVGLTLSLFDDDATGAGDRRPLKPAGSSPVHGAFLGSPEVYLRAEPASGESPALSGTVDGLPTTNGGDFAPFDIVISNPPYVRQELIEPAVKVEALRVCRTLLPAARPLDGKSDLYAYFYHLGLGLLREGGVLCVISSNSWLDTGFGVPLQDLLLQHSRILAVIESASDATFADARVNPAIGLFRRVSGQETGGGWARFIRMNRSLDEECAAGEVAQLAGEEFVSRPAYRVVPVRQASLMDRVGRSGGNWGGWYLRAPDLFHELLAGCGERLVRLDALADLRFGIKTGANDFFYLEDITAGVSQEELAQFGVSLVRGDVLRLCRNGVGHVCAIEARYLRPALRSPREIASPELADAAGLDLLFCCAETREALAGTHALAYIEYGEAELGVSARPSVRGRPAWYVVPRIAPPPVVAPLIAFERACAAVNPHGTLCDANLVGVYPRDERHGPALTACLASSLGVLMRELAGIANLGQGALKLNPAYSARLLVPDVRAASPAELAQLAAAFDAVRRLPFPAPGSGAPPPEWRRMDTAVLALLGSRAPEPERVQTAARDLVAARVARANSR